MLSKIIMLLLVLTVAVVTAETITPHSGKVETQVGLVDPFTLEQTPVTVVLQAEPVITAQETPDYRGTTSLFQWVRNDTASKAILISDGNGDWDWHRPIIIPGRPDHRSPFTPDQEY